MTGKEMFEALSNIDDEIVDEARLDEQDIAGKKKSYKWVAIVVMSCLCLIGGTSIAAPKLSQILFHGNILSGAKGYSITTDIKRFSRKDFKGDVLEVEGIIKQQIAVYKPHMSQLPTYWYKHYESFEKIYEYLGLEVLKDPSLNMEATDISLSILGNNEGKFEQLYISTDYSNSNFIMQSFAYIWTEYSNSDTMTLRNVTSDSHLSIPYTNKNGKECIIVGTTTNVDGYWSKDGYVVDDGILYWLHVAYQSNQAMEAQNIVTEWLDKF